MCNKAVCIDPYSLEFVPGRLKTEEMCNKAVQGNHHCMKNRISQVLEYHGKLKKTK